MDRVILLIISILSSSSALQNGTDTMPSETSSQCANSTECMKPVGRDSLLPQLFPLFITNKSQNGTIDLQDFPSSFIYANSSILRMGSTQHQLNLTENEYSADDIAIIMAYPISYTNVSSLESNESISTRSSSTANSSFDFEVKDGLNISKRSLDLSELLAFLAPFNLMGHKVSALTTTPSYPTPKPVYEDPYPQVVAAYAEKAPNYDSVPMKPAVLPPNLEVSYN